MSLLEKTGFYGRGGCKMPTISTARFVIHTNLAVVVHCMGLPVILNLVSSQFAQLGVCQVWFCMCFVNLVKMKMWFYI